MKEDSEVESILKDINSVVGVTGSFVCDDEGRVLAKGMPGVFGEDLLSPAGRTMAQTIAGLKIARRRKAGDIDLLYDQGRLIVKPVGEGCLCILCVRRINVPLLNLTANVAVKRLEERMKERIATRPVAKPPAREKPEPLSEEAEAEPGPRRSLAEVMAANIRR